MTSRSTTPLARQLYRNLLQSARLAFEGDARLLANSQAEIRRQFRDNTSLNLGDAKLREKLDHGQEVAGFLRRNVVQGKLEGAEEQARYKLRIHEHTERRDNGALDVDFLIPGGGCDGKQSHKK